VLDNPLVSPLSDGPLARLSEPAQSIQVAGERVAVSTGSAVHVLSRANGALVQEIALGPDEEALFGAGGQTVVIVADESLDLVSVGSKRRRQAEVEVYDHMPIVLDEAQASRSPRSSRRSRPSPRGRFCSVWPMDKSRAGAPRAERNRRRRSARSVDGGSSSGRLTTAG
jgi:hypothetical protein